MVLWDTLLDGRFDRREVRVVIAHELGHIAHDHTLKRVGWLLLFLLPASALVALATARRGGLARPEAVPARAARVRGVAAAASPLMNIVSRREEAEADWSALRATRDPAAARCLFVKLAQHEPRRPRPARLVLRPVRRSPDDRAARGDGRRVAGAPEPGAEPRPRLGR